MNKSTTPPNHSLKTQAKYETAGLTNPEPKCNLNNPTRNWSDSVARDYGDKK